MVGIPFQSADRNARCVEHGERTHGSVLPVTRALDRIVHRRVHMLADEIDADFAAALERYVGELHAQRLLELDRDDLVFLRRPRAAHLHPVVAARALLDRRNVFLRGFIRRLRVHPENELVERHAGDRSQVLPIERDAGGERRGEKVGERDDDGVGVALFALDLEEAFGARPARLVYGDQGTRRELVLLGDSRDQPGHLVGAAARCPPG